MNTGAVTGVIPGTRSLNLLNSKTRLFFSEDHSDSNNTNELLCDHLQPGGQK